MSNNSGNRDTEGTAGYPPPIVLSPQAREDLMVVLQPLLRQITSVWSKHVDAPSVAVTSLSGTLSTVALRAGEGVQSPRHGCAVIVIASYDDANTEALRVAAIAGIAAEANYDRIALDDTYLLEVQYPHRTARGRWWGVDGLGYTDDLLRAGTFTRSDAEARAARSDRSVAVCLHDVLDQVCRGELHEHFLQQSMSGTLFPQLPGSVGAVLNFDVRRAFLEHVRRYVEPGGGSGGQ